MQGPVEEFRTPLLLIALNTSLSIFQIYPFPIPLRTLKWLKEATTIISSRYVLSYQVLLCFLTCCCLVYKGCADW